MDLNKTCYLVIHCSQCLLSSMCFGHQNEELQCSTFNFLFHSCSVSGTLHRSTPPPTYQESIANEEPSHNGNSAHHADLSVHNESTTHQEYNQQTASGSTDCDDGVGENVCDTQQIANDYSSYKKNQECSAERYVLKTFTLDFLIKYYLASLHWQERIWDFVHW